MSKDLILNSLYIKGFRGLRELKIESLGRVNLITGKNNTGKSSILEALALYASGFAPQMIADVQIDRGERQLPTEDSSGRAAANLKFTSSLFFGRSPELNKQEMITVGDLSSSDNHQKSLLKLRLIYYYIETLYDKEGNETSRKKILSDLSKDGELALEIESSEGKKILNLDSLMFNKYSPYKQKIPSEYIRSSSRFSLSDLAKLFDRISLTEKQNVLLEALGIINSDIAGVAFIQPEKSAVRTPIIKLGSSSEILPLQSMGDGINRILSIILAQVNADNGFLLVDEFENGLHYSVQDQLWEMVFQLALDLNVQVFATTHSNDCIQSFERVLNSGKAGFDGKLIRLENQNGEIKEVPFSAEELKIASKHQIEVR